MKLFITAAVATLLAVAPVSADQPLEKNFGAFVAKYGAPACVAESSYEGTSLDVTGQCRATPDVAELTEWLSYSRLEGSDRCTFVYFFKADDTVYLADWDNVLCG